MDTSTVVDLGRYALWMTALISAPLLLVALGVGLVIGILQAATSINEMTLSLSPKLFALGPGDGAILAAGRSIPWWNSPATSSSAYRRCSPRSARPMNLLVADIVERFYTFLWPMLRISGLLLTAPLFSQNAVNVRLRVLLGLVLTWLIYPYTIGQA